jgi:hypothetical protein
MKDLGAEKVREGISIHSTTGGLSAFHQGISPSAAFFLVTLPHTHHAAPISSV